MPRSVYCPLRHMSHSPTAQFGHGTGSGRRTMPTTRSPSRNPLPGPGSSMRPSDSWPSTETGLLRRRPPVQTVHDLDVSAANPDRDRLDEYGSVARIRLGDVLEAGGLWLLRFDSNRFHVDLERRAKCMPPDAAAESALLRHSGAAPTPWGLPTFISSASRRNHSKTAACRAVGLRSRSCSAGVQ